MHTTKVFSKKYVSDSEESIENLLYYQDCNHRAKEMTHAPAPLNQELRNPPQPECPYPKMCCSMSCGNDCGGTHSMLGRPMEPMQSSQPFQPLSNQPRQPMLPTQPQLIQRGRKKKMNLLNNISPIGGRRDSGFTKDRIKNLISQDQDIRKILKDLVRVTMQKVDLLELVNARRSMNTKTADASANSEEENPSVD